jgi:hypothetical protein
MALWDFARLPINQVPREEKIPYASPDTAVVQ